MSAPFEATYRRWLHSVWWRDRQFLGPECRGDFEDLDDSAHRAQFHELWNFDQSDTAFRRWLAQRQSNAPVKYSMRAVTQLQLVEEFLLGQRTNT